MGKVSSKACPANGWLKRLLLQLVEGAVADVKAMETRPELASHRLRVRMKKTGALLRLAKPVVSKVDRKRMRGQMRRIKDGCAGQRDAAVVAKLAEELGNKNGLHFVQAAKRDAPLPSAERLRGQLSRLRRGLGAETFAGLSWDQVRDEYSACYKAGRQCMRKACRTDKAEDYHEWRKRVKTLYFQMVALHGSVPHLRKRMQRTHKLGHLLGNDHDLTMLEEQTVAQSPGSPWQAIIAKQRKQLRARIVKLGEKVYEQSPRRFTRLRRLPGEE